VGNLHREGYGSGNCRRYQRVGDAVYAVASRQSRHRNSYRLVFRAGIPQGELGIFSKIGVIVIIKIMVIYREGEIALDRFDSRRGKTSAKNQQYCYQ